MSFFAAYQLVAETTFPLEVFTSGGKIFYSNTPS